TRVDFIAGCFEATRNDPRKRSEDTGLKVRRDPLRCGHQLFRFIDSPTTRESKPVRSEVIALHARICHSRFSRLESLDCAVRSASAQVNAGREYDCVDLSVDVALLGRKLMRASERPERLVEAAQAEGRNRLHFEGVWQD